MSNCHGSHRILTAVIAILVWHACNIHALVPVRRTSFVTGANGYVGRAIVHELLISGPDAQERRTDSTSANHCVVCLVRPSRVASEQEYWKSQTPRVRVMEYDMLDGGASLRQALLADTPDEGDKEAEATKGLKPEQHYHVFHVASVFGPTEDHKQTALDNVRGTEDVVRVLSEVQKQQPAVQCKLILTSSMAAVRGSGQLPQNGQFYTHLDWNAMSELGVSWGASYQWSKTESERKARELSNQCGLPLVVLNPSFVFGPGAEGCVSSSYSFQLVGQWVRGQSPVQSRLFVDIRDVAKAHVAAARSPDTAGQRFILSTERRVSSKEIAGWLKEIAIETGLADPDKIHFDQNFDGGAIPIGSKEVEATNRLKEAFGIELRQVKDTIREMASSLLRDTAPV